ncbi:dynamin family protein [Akkermansiaceae bacterium]|nr:dynamin family protein [Akkermansiaceae bacterium]MDB4537003.1 dynamin family protein [Akkermansiaceae bacterium]
MFGDRYFATRQRFTDVVTRVRDLGEECEIDVEALLEEGDFLKELRRPFLVVFCGETNSGKSTLINGLFGKNLCEVCDRPNTQKITRYQWGSRDKTDDSDAHVTERFLPFDFLKEFHLVDTPGADARTPGNTESIEKFLPIADLIIFALPASNPWSASTWQLVARLPSEQLKNVVFVLQQADLKSEGDIEVILGHMQKLGEQKTGEIPRIFPVSAKLACEARQKDPRPERMWQLSGFPPLESFITRKVSGNFDRHRILRDIWDATQSTLNRIEQGIQERRITLDSDEYFLKEIETEVHVRRDGQASAFSRKFSTLGDVFSEQGKESLEALGSQLSLVQSLFSLFRRERLPTRIEKQLIEAVKNAVEEHAAKDGSDLVQNCRNHWETAVPRIEERLDQTPPDFNLDADSLSGARQHFVDRLGEASKLSVANLKIRGTLDMQMEERRTVLRYYMTIILTAIMAAGIFGGLGIALAPWISLGVALFFLLGAGLYSQKSKKLLRANYAERIDDLRQPFAESLANDYKEGVREFYVEYGGLFEIVRRRIADQKLLLKPRLQRWNNLFLELKAIEQEI